MRTAEAILLGVLLAFAPAFAGAQVVDKKTLTLEGARSVIAEARAYAQKNNAPGAAIAVVDDGGNLMALERLDGTFAAGANIAIGKARTAVLFKHPTAFFEDVIKNGRTAMVTLPDFTPLQGGVPILYNNEIVGAIGVSGAANAAQDTEVATAGANLFATAAAPQSGSIKYFESSAVKTAFQKGMPLLEQQNYKIHASHRDQAGMAEVHTSDTDIIYVLEGTATFVTGGTVVDGKNIAPDEIRGASIQGGDKRKLVKGDVIVVPSGVPHQFAEVTSPFNYYVVKVAK